MVAFRPIFALSLVLAAGIVRADSRPVNRPGLPLRPEATEVRLIDGSRLHLTLNEQRIEVATAYGQLVIKLSDVQRIEFGTRLPAEVASKAAAAVALVKSSDGSQRDAGWKSLADLKENAYPSLLLLERNGDPSVSAKAGELLAALRKSVPEKKLRKIDRDVIYTEFSKIVGHIESTGLQAHTPHFGDLNLRMTDLAWLRTGNHEEEDEGPITVLPDPGTLTQYQQRVGQTFYFRVRAHANGSVWGSDVYTTDSLLATVAIHAGVLKSGETGVVKVTIMPGQNGYVGSTRNGISTSGYGVYPSSYRVSKVGHKSGD